MSKEETAAVPPVRQVGYKTMVVTGGTGGIGFQTALALARTGAHLVVTGRDAARGEEAVRAIRQSSDNPHVDLELADLSRRSEVASLAERIGRRFPRLDVLINNAGSLTTTRKRTEDGMEFDFAVNVAAPILLTRALGDSLTAARPARVINVTGGAPFGGVKLEVLETASKAPGLAWYSMTKRAMEAASLQLSQELAPLGIHLNIVYPGGASTAMTQGMTPRMVPLPLRVMWPLFKWMMAPDQGRGAAKAARSSVWAATAPELDGAYGRYFDTNCKPARLHATVRDVKVQQGVRDIIDAARLS